MAPDGASEVNTELIKLRAELKSVCQHRDELERDVENLCMQGSFSFSSSSVLSDRIRQAEREVAKMTSQLEVLTAERDNLREDLRGTRDAKRLADQSWRAQNGKLTKVEAELAFYQKEVATAVSDRDRASWEAEELRANTLSLEDQLQDAQAQADSMQSELTKREHELSHAHSNIARLEHLARECEAIPGLRADLQDAQARGDELQVARDQLQEMLRELKQGLKSSQEDCARLRAEGQDFRDQLATAQNDAREQHQQQTQANTQLQSELDAALKKQRELQTEAQQAGEAASAAQADAEAVTRERDQAVKQAKSEASRKERDMLASHTSEASRLRDELASLKQEHAVLATDFEQTRASKVAALMRASQAEDTAGQAFEEVGHMRDTVADLKERLVQASKEKVAALVQAADARQGRTADGNLKSPGQARGWGARIWGQGSLPPGTEAAADHPPGLKRSESSASPEGKSAASLRRSTSTAVSPDARGTAGKPPENAVLNNGQVSDAEGPLSPSPKKAEAE